VGMSPQGEQTSWNETACGYYAALLSSGSFLELKQGGVWVSRHLAGLWLIPGVKELKQGGVWVSHHLIRLWLVHGVNDLEQGSVLVHGANELE